MIDSHIEIPKNSFRKRKQKEDDRKLDRLLHLKYHALPRTAVEIDFQRIVLEIDDYRTRTEYKALCRNTDDYGLSDLDIPEYVSSESAGRN